MFGHNEATGQKFFRESSEAQLGKLLVTSVFRTLQGEGPLAGRPAVFVRLAKCQLSCSFCDTYFDTGEWIGVADLIDRVDVAGRSGDDALVITGGEPALQPLLGDFVARAWTSGLFSVVQIETNGVAPLPDLPEEVVVVVSPKCAERGGHPTQYLNPSLATLGRASCLKFVVSGDPKSPYSEVPGWALGWREGTGREIYVSPMAEYLRPPEEARALYESRRASTLGERSAAERVSFWESGLLDLGKCRRNYEYAAQYVMRHNLRLSIQQQLFASLP